jgi:hypothetical protein
MSNVNPSVVTGGGGGTFMDKVRYALADALDFFNAND